MSNTLLEGLQTPPRKASPFSMIRVAVVLDYIRLGASFWTAMDKAGYSQATAAKWKARAQGGEEPYHSFYAMCERAHEGYLSNELNMTAERAEAIVSNVAG